jgi:hypothetical protein
VNGFEGLLDRRWNGNERNMGPFLIGRSLVHDHRGARSCAGDSQERGRTKGEAGPPSHSAHASPQQSQHEPLPYRTSSARGYKHRVRVQSTTMYCMYSVRSSARTGPSRLQAHACSGQQGSHPPCPPLRACALTTRRQTRGRRREAGSSGGSEAARNLH